ncbi:SCO3242 family prenyltransferase [Streptomyces sp. NPDC004647]|uniref:SCO3242 family prenyltransferase n=1 Tax=Streptomyces sp. NPDC004647 TaxID=3154671 RepID=UPI0033BAB93B
MLRISAVFTVPGDALAGAAATGRRPHRGTLLAAGTSLCLYEAGMALNDWADRDIDTVERPHRPLPSGRIKPGAALAAAGGLTAAGLALAAAAGRPALATATALAGSVWAYDLRLKNTAAGPAVMAAARALDLLLGATATATAPSPGRSISMAAEARPAGGQDAVRAALPSALLLGAHTLAVTVVSRHEVQGGSSAPPLAALAATAGIAWSAARDGTGIPPAPASGPAQRAARIAVTVIAASYGATAARPFAHAALNPSPQLLQRAVGGGIRAMIPLQAALAARAGAVHTALPLLAVLPVARRLSRRVSPT